MTNERFVKGSYKRATHNRKYICASSYYNYRRVRMSCNLYQYAWIIIQHWFAWDHGIWSHWRYDGLVSSSNVWQILMWHSDFSHLIEIINSFIGERQICRLLSNPPGIVIVGELRPWIGIHTIIYNVPKVDVKLSQRKMVTVGESLESITIWYQYATLQYTMILPSNLYMWKVTLSDVGYNLNNTLL